MSRLCTIRSSRLGLFDISFANLNGIINAGLNIPSLIVSRIDLYSTCVCNDLSSFAFATIYLTVVFATTYLTVAFATIIQIVFGRIYLIVMSAMSGAHGVAGWVWGGGGWGYHVFVVKVVHI